MGNEAVSYIDDAKLSSSKVIKQGICKITFIDRLEVRLGMKLPSFSLLQRETSTLYVSRYSARSIWYAFKSEILENIGRLYAWPCPWVPSLSCTEYDQKGTRLGICTFLKVKHGFFIEVITRRIHHEIIPVLRIIPRTLKCTKSNAYAKNNLWSYNTTVLSLQDENMSTIVMLWCLVLAIRKSRRFRARSLGTLPTQ